MDAAQHEHIVKVYWDLWEQVRTDPEYARLCAELEGMAPRYEAILSALPEPDRAVLDRYITLRESMNRRMLEFACGELVLPFPRRAGGTAPADQVR